MHRVRTPACEILKTADERGTETRAKIASTHNTALLDTSRH